MPATVVLVHEDAVFRRTLAQAFAEKGLEVAAFSDALEAMMALENAHRVQILITQIDFAPGKSNGVALARMMRVRRTDAAAFFLGDQSLHVHAVDVGIALPAEIEVPELVGHALAELQKIREV